MDIVLHVPKSFPDIQMIQEANLGRKMNAVEITECFNEFQGFKSFGWTVSNLNPETDLPSDNTFRIRVFATYSDFQLSATKNRTASESERGRLVRIERVLARDNPLTIRDAGG